MVQLAWHGNIQIHVIVHKGSTYIWLVEIWYHMGIPFPLHVHTIISVNRGPEKNL